MDKHYQVSAYDSLSRFISYHNQKKLIIDSGAATVLNVGKGSGFLGDYFSNRSVNLTDSDYDHMTNPDLLLDITAPLEHTQKYDAVCAFQVLEHLPFESLSNVFDNFQKLTNKTLLISVPERSLCFGFEIKAPRLSSAFKFHLGRFWSSSLSSKWHYWELGLKDKKLKDFLNVANKHFLLKEHFVPFNNTYHHFFVFEKRIQPLQQDCP